MTAKLNPVRGPGRACVIVCGLLLAFTAVPSAVGQEPAPEPPVETVPVDTEPAPDPDPAPGPEPAPPPAEPAPAPPVSPPPASLPPAVSPPVSSPPPEVVEPEPTGPTAEERKRRQRERERKAAERLRKQHEQSVAGGFAAFMETLGQGIVPEVPVAEAPVEEPVEEQPPVATVNPEPASQPVAVAFPDIPPPSQSSLAGAAPILLALLGLAVALLGLAALPPWSVRSLALAGLLAQRRLEIGLIGTAVLVSAAIGLTIAVVAG